MYKKLQLLLALTLSCFSGVLYAQRENVWITTNNITNRISPDTAGIAIDFNSGSPVIADSLPFVNKTNTWFNGNTHRILSIASICDLSGNLLFYTEGERIWSRTGVLMPNANGLTGIPILGDYSSTLTTDNGALIVPVVNNPDRYYVFSLTGLAGEDLAGVRGNLYYSIVDMSLNGGYGDIVPGQKGILIDTNISHSMYATIGEDCNYWLVAVAFSDITGKSDLFKSFEITEKGINRQPVISNVGDGMVRGLPSVAGMERGGLKISPDGKKLIRTRMTTEKSMILYDFNRSSGIVSNPKYLKESPLTAMLGKIVPSRPCFSPNSRYLYILGWDDTYVDSDISGFHATAVLKYDLRDTSIIAINNSKTVADGDLVWPDFMKMGPDGKIYYSGITESSDGSMTYNLYFRTLDNPDSPGPAQTTTLPLKSAAYDYMQADVAQLIPDTVYTARQVTLCSNQPSILLSTSANNSLWYKWNDGATIKTKSVTASGTYWAAHANDCAYSVDTFIVTRVDLDPIITVNKFELSTTADYDSYQWYIDDTPIPGAVQKTLIVSRNGNYTVAVSDESGCIDTSAIYKVTNFGVGMHDVIVAAPIKIYPNPAHNMIFVEASLSVNLKITGIEGKCIKEKAHASAIAIDELADGIYLLHITDAKGTLLKIEKFIKAK